MSDQDPTFSPLSMACVPFQVVRFNRSGCTGQGIPVETEFFPSLGCEIIFPSWQDVPVQILVHNSFPRHAGAWDPWGELGQWLCPVISTTLRCRVPWQGSPVQQSGPQALLVAHSNVLKPGQYCSPPGQGGFTYYSLNLLL